MRRGMQVLRRAAVIGVLASAAFDCSSDSDPPPPELTIVSHWAGALRRGLEALLDVHKVRHPEVAFRFGGAPVDDQGFVNKEFVASAIESSFSYVPNLFAVTQPLGVSSESWNAFRPETLEPLTFQGSLRGVPLSLTRTNLAYWNKRELDTLALTKKIPETIAELEGLVERGVGGRVHAPSLLFRKGLLGVEARAVRKDIVPAWGGPQFSKD